ncbi:hypothetical protein RhiTH_010119 [Rhizoctonia solani]
MAHPERVPLSSIKTLVLYADEYTTSRRTSPLPQLECTGSACRDFQPSSVYCTKTTDSDWKCEADLPSSLRFGKLHVSCEGWDRPGDPHVLKGRSWSSGTPGGGPRNEGGGWPWPWGGGGRGGGGRGGGPGSSNDAPPPYTKSRYRGARRRDVPLPNSAPRHYLSASGNGMGLGPRASMFSSGTSTGPYRPETSAFQRRQEYDGHGFGAAGAGSSTGPGTRLGEMRRATGYAGTSVR